MRLFTRQGRGWMLLLTAAVAALAVVLSGCGDDDNPTNNGGGTLSCGTRECMTAVMPDGKTWMTENLNVETADSWCYKDSPDSCAKYGRLYTWNAAKTACPSGWRLPTRDEWGALAKAAGGTGDYGERGVAGRKLKAASGWNNNGNGTDDFGFSALPGGRRFTDGYFSWAGIFGYWWTATERSSGSAYNRYIDYGEGDDFVIDGFYDKGTGYSVRCVEE